MDLVAQLNTSLDGRYSIDREIGRGGMATVYLARDTRHDRRVALKVLSPDLGAVVGIDRFLAEIKVTANLQHPNLLPLFDSGEADGHLFYVMPFVEGESLRARLAREKQLPVDEALRIATSIAGALDYAHRHGVIHRDLKPENVLMHEGQPLVADFGIALAVANAGGSRITQTGVSLGTPQYMSPEQATGDRVIDGRTDIYSLGAMLYEMLVGDPPHIGSTSQAVIAKVLTEKPHPVRTSRPNVAPHVDAAVACALEKLPADRFATAQDFADALAGRVTAMPAAASARVPSSATRATRFGAKDVIYGLLLLVAVVFGAVEWRTLREARPLPVVRLQVAIPKNLRFNDGLTGTNLALSPQGDRLAYIALTASAGGGQLFVRGMDQLEAKDLTNGALGSGRNPAFSPDGKWIAFTDGIELKKISVDGGPPVTLATLSDVPQGVSWGTAGSIVVGGAAAGLSVVPERGGPSRTIPKAADEGANRWPLLLPDGKTVVYVATLAGMTSNGRLHVRSLDGGPPTNLDLTGSPPLGYLEGQLIYVVPGGGIMAVAFDAKRRATTGSPVPVGADVVTEPTGGAKAAISQSGMFVYRSGKSESQPVLARGTSVAPLNVEPRNYLSPRFSPDGQRIAFTVETPQSTDIWILGRAQGTLTRVTSGGVNQRPEWTSDGKRILFVSDRGGSPQFWWQPADASAAAELLYAPDEGDPFEAVMSPDAKWLVYRTGPASASPRSVFAVALGGKSKSVPLLSGGYIQQPRLSPDGHWLAYQSNTSGKYEIYVRPFPDSGGRVQVSAGGGTEPLWARSGHTLYYRTPEGVVSVSVTTGTSFSIGERKVVLAGDFLLNPSHQNYDVSPDGQDFLMLRHSGDEIQTIVVQNWVRELVARTTSSPRR